MESGQVIDNGWVRVVPQSQLVAGGDGAVVELPAVRNTDRVGERGFVIRHATGLGAFVNRCAHVPVELDWLPGRFFDADGDALICSLHAALYDPASGHCIGGACRGRGSLEPLELRIDDEGWILVRRCPPSGTVVSK